MSPRPSSNSEGPTFSPAWVPDPPPHLPWTLADISPVLAGRGAPGGPGVVSNCQASGALRRRLWPGVLGAVARLGRELLEPRGEPGGWQREHSPTLQRVPWEPGHRELVAGYGSALRRAGGTREWDLEGGIWVMLGWHYHPAPARKDWHCAAYSSLSIISRSLSCFRLPQSLGSWDQP